MIAPDAAVAPITGVAPVAAFILGCLGGILAELLSLNKHRMQIPGEWPAYLRSWPYWAYGAAMVAAGGILAYAFAKTSPGLSTITGLTTGLTAPLFLETVIRRLPDPSSGGPGPID